MKRDVVFLLVAAGFLFFARPVFAKMVNGKVVSVDAATRKLTLNVTDAVSGKDTSTDLWLDADAALTGITAVSDLKAGDGVWVETDQDSEGNWRIHKMTRG